MESRGSLGRPGVCSLEPPQPGFQFRGHVIVTVPGCGGEGLWGSASLQGLSAPSAQRSWHPAFSATATSCPPEFPCPLAY